MAPRILTFPYPPRTQRSCRGSSGGASMLVFAYVPFDCPMCGDVSETVGMLAEYHPPLAAQVLRYALCVGCRDEIMRATPVRRRELSQRAELRLTAAGGSA